MPNFTYKARNNVGKLVQGSMEASGREELVAKLQRLGYTVTQITEKAKGFSIDEFLQSLTPVKIDEMVAFMVQLANMIGAGLTLPNSINILTEQTTNVRLKNALKEVHNDIKGGSNFSDALRKHPGIFSNLFVNMIGSGETSGNLDEVLSRLAKFIEQEAEFRQKLMTAMFYPLILAVAGTLVIIFIVLTILPTFAKIFIDAKVPLPLPTLVLFNMNLFIRRFWILLIIAVGGAFAAFTWFKGTPTGKSLIDRTVLKLPVWGTLTRSALISRFSRTLASLVSSGVPMLQSLETTERTLDNAVMSKVIKNVYSSVSKGEGISGPLKASGEFPPMPVHMIAVGEETGALDSMLTKVADYYDMTASYSIKKVTALLEPIFLVVIGGMVGFIFASIILPIFNMMQTLKH
ncbi:type II secretion system F family protein [Candidatus Margulisiibacteriota bacterium]